MIMWSLFSNYFFLNHIVYCLRTIRRFHLLELNQIDAHSGKMVRV